MNSESARANKRVFIDIAPASWEHPADRAALQTLRAVPGFDLLLKRTIGAIGEHGIRMMFQANAVRVQEDQYPTLHRALLEVKRTLDYAEEVPLFVSQAPWFNAGAYGMDKPFIVVNSAAIDLLDERELRVLLAHEMGHVMSGHALYHTMLVLLLTLGLRYLPLAAGIAVVPIRLALEEWSRKSELSADRASLLGSQDPEATLSLFLKAAGGNVANKHELNVQAYARQIKEYEETPGSELTSKVLNFMNRTHPVHTFRAVELRRWEASEQYRTILGGKYRRRTESIAANYGADLGDAANHYVPSMVESARELGALCQDLAREIATYAQKAEKEVSVTMDRLFSFLAPRESGGAGFRDTQKS